MTGARFHIFPRPPALHPGWPPEIVTLRARSVSIGPGPSDDRIYVIDPIGKDGPYGINAGPLGTPHLELPPWRGPIYPRAEPDAAGHFDHIPFDTPEFLQAHVFGVISFVLEAWERYFHRPISWHFGRDFDRLEVVMLPDFNNAHVGYGFMEVGGHHWPDGTTAPFALNFDVIAHELGHLIIYGTIGVPTAATERGEYFGFQESAADMTAIISALHFGSLVDRLLEDTHGNLYTYNELDRFAELSATEQIRLANNSVKLSEFSRGWSDEHALSQPLTGALFDLLVDIFQENLVDSGLILRSVADLTERLEHDPEYVSMIQPAFDHAFAGRSAGFRAALDRARDYLGLALAETWKRLSPDFFGYDEVAAALLEVDGALTGGRYQSEIVESFAWREIGAVTVGPRVSPPDRSSHVHSARTVVPRMGDRLPKMSYRERMMVRRGAPMTRNHLRRQTWLNRY